MPARPRARQAAPGEPPQGPDRKTARRLAERQRHQQRELAQTLQDRAGRDSYPMPDDGPAPRID